VHTGFPAPETRQAAQVVQETISIDFGHLQLRHWRGLSCRLVR
jgi:hypothetical protein